jgi:hypothetical protein
MVLQRDGHLPAGQVHSIAIGRVHDEQVYSVGHFLAVQYSPDAPRTAPGHLFLKLPRSGGDQAAIAWHGEREVRMYRALAPDQRDLPLIPCYDAVYDPARRLYHLLLADLSATHDQPASWNISDRYITQTVDCLARFHAYWWEHPRLTKGPGELPTRDWLAAEIAQLQGAYATFAEVVGGRLTADDRRIYERVLQSLPVLWAGRTELSGQTMVHGDAHFWNFLYPLDPQTHRTYILDWQSYHVSPGTKDLAYTIVLRYPQRTPDNERILVKRYHDGLVRHGVTGYRWQSCWLDYRRMAAEHVLYPLRWWMSGLPEEFWERFIDPALTGFRELGCTDLLE